MINVVKNHTDEINLKAKGIYLISHKDKPNHFYVGSTKCKNGFYKRWYSHILNLKKNIHHSPKLQNTINKYGINGLVFVILEIMNNFDSLYIREQFWIDHCNSIGELYNYAPVVDAHCYNVSDKTKQKISKSLKGKYTGAFSPHAKLIHQYSEHGEFIKTFSSIVEICNEIDSKNNNLHNRKIPIFHKGFIYSRRLLNEDEINYFREYGGCHNYHRRKPILQYDLNGNLIKKWSSTEDAAKFFNITSGALNQALRGNVKVCKNSIWKYSTEQNIWDTNTNR